MPRLALLNETRAFISTAARKKKTPTFVAATLKSTAQNRCLLNLLNVGYRSCLDAALSTMDNIRRYTVAAIEIRLADRLWLKVLDPVYAMDWRWTNPSRRTSMCSSTFSMVSCCLILKIARRWSGRFSRTALITTRWVWRSNGSSPKISMFCLGQLNHQTKILSKRYGMTLKKYLRKLDLPTFRSWPL